MLVAPDPGRVRLRNSCRAVIGVGFAAGHGLFLLRTNTRWTVSKTVNIATLAISGAAGAATVHAFRTGNREDVTPRLIIALILGGSSWADGWHADLAIWQDWLMAVRTCRLAAGGSTQPFLELG